MNGKKYHVTFPSEERRRVLVYVSGPMFGAMATNVSKACIVAGQLLDLGYAVELPHTSVVFEMISPHTAEEWLNHDFEKMRHCDAMLRLPGNSEGADLEEQWAKVIKLPVYHSIETLQAGFPRGIAVGLASPRR